MYGRNVRQRHNGGKSTNRKRVKTHASKNIKKRNIENIEKIKANE
jgi:hypothetical protein